ncbi:hypothetical protein [Methylobacterium sp. JK268]
MLTTARRAILLGLALPGCAPALAQPATPRIAAPALRCGEVETLVNRAGAAIVATSPFTYERLVRDVGFCSIEQTTAPFFGPASDGGQCFLGYRCRDRSTEGRRD